MASEFPGNRAGKGFHSRVHALPYAGAHHSIELQHREADDHHRTDVDVSPALVSVHDSKAGGCTDRRWGRAARTTPGRLAPASSIFEHAESQHDASLELFLHHLVSTERKSDARDLYRIRSAAAFAAAARC